MKLGKLKLLRVFGTSKILIQKLYYIETIALPKLGKEQLNHA